MATGIGRPHLSVVVPAYNEESRLERSLRSIGDYLRTSKLDAEIIVVDDGSTDGTAAVAAEFLRDRRGRLLREPENRGKGNAVRRGVLESRGNWVLFSDADLSTPIEEHAKLTRVALERDLDVVIGSRGLADSQVQISQGWLRRTMGKTFNRVLRAATGLPFQDTQCGFKLMDRVRTRPIFERMVVDRFAFDVELLFLCVRFGLKVGEVPVIWRDSPGSKVGLFSAPPQMLFDLLRIRWRFRRGKYNPDTPLIEPGPN